MTTIDEEVLRQALHEATSDFEPSASAVDDILRAARSSISDDSSAPVVRALRGHPRRQRLLAAAAAVVAVSAIAIPLLTTESPNLISAANGSVSGQPGIPISGSGYIPYGLTVKTGTHGSPQFSVTPTSAQSRRSAATSSTKIESTGQVSLSVARGRISASFAALTRLVVGDGGTVSASQIQTANDGHGNFAYGTITLQVTQPRFAQLVRQVQSVGHVTNVTTSSVDVTSQYVDLSARINALETARRQYLGIMAKAHSIGDILAVQAQLNSLQSRLEQLQGQLNLLDHQTTYAALSVNVTEKGHHAAPPVHQNGLSKAFHDSVHGFVAGVEWLVRAVGPALFALICLALLWLLGRRAWRALRREVL